MLFLFNKLLIYFHVHASMYAYYVYVFQLIQLNHLGIYHIQFLLVLNCLFVFQIKILYLIF